MPRTLPAGMATAIGKQAGFGSIALLDIALADGSGYFLTDNNYSQYPVRIGNGFNLIADPDTMASWPSSLTALVAGAGLVRGSAWKHVGTGAASGFHFANSQVINVTAGAVYELSGYIDATQVTAGSPTWNLFDPTITTNYGGIGIAAGGKGRVSVTITIPGGVTQVLVLCDTSNCTIVNAANLLFSNPQLEPGAVANLYCGQNYLPWLKSVGPLTLSRDFTTDAGDLIFQNLSGNTIDRDFASSIKNHEFEGALAILRLWLPLFADSMLEFHGYLSEQKPTDEEVSFRLLQLADVAQFNVADDVVGELCTWRYKSAQCGSTGSAAACPKRFIDCKDATRAAQERFNGVLSPAPSNTVANVPPVVTVPGTGGGGGRAGNGSNSDSPGRGRRPLMDNPL
jgi:hypothetical protein